MKNVSVLGAGMVGRAIARDLNYKFNVTSYDIDPKNLKELDIYNIKSQVLDLSDIANIIKAIENADIVVNATPGFMGFNTLKTIIKSKRNVIDISFFPEDALELDELAKENGITAIVDIGVAPGISNFLLGFHNRKMMVNDFKCYVGGLPELREYPFQYKAPFSPIDVIEEYTRTARFVEDGKIISKPAMTDREYLFFDDIGTLEAFNSDGLRSLIKTINAPNMIEKTLRYPGHIENIILLRDMGFFENKAINFKGQEINILDFTSRVLIDKWKLNSEDVEFTVMKIIINGIENNRPVKYTYDLYDRTDTLNDVSSMARTTGYTATSVVNLFSDGLFDQKGVFPPENIAIKDEIYDYIFSYLELRGVHYKLGVEYL